MSRRLVATAFAAALAAAAPARAEEYATFRTLPVTPVADGGSPGCISTALLNRPATWNPGGAAVVMLSRTPQPVGLGDSLLAALLGQQAAVLEVTPGSCETDPGLADVRQDALDVLAGALVALRAAGAGLVVAVGHGEAAAAAAIEATNGPALDSRLGPGGPRFAAGLGLGGGAPAYAAGAQQPVREPASSHVFALCGALAQVMPAAEGSAAACASMLADSGQTSRRSP